MRKDCCREFTENEFLELDRTGYGAGDCSGYLIMGCRFCPYCGNDLLESMRPLGFQFRVLDRSERIAEGDKFWNAVKMDWEAVGGSLISCKAGQCVMVLRKERDLFVGQRVHYQPHYYPEDRFGNGIIKRIEEEHVWVVYDCDEDWDRYMEYTGALTNLRDLKEGWR